MDARAQQAREHHRRSLLARKTASHHLAARDALIRRLYAEGGWTYTQLAQAVGCTREVIAKIIRPQER